MISWKISSRVCSHCTSGPGRPRCRAIRAARSNATQLIRREYVNSCLPPRTSQMPSSRSRQWSVRYSSSLTMTFHRSYEIGAPNLL